MDLLENAIQSIQVGVEDYLADSNARLLSAARNIHAGILLLFKEALYRLSPDGSNGVLIMSKVVPEKRPDGKIVFVGQGTHTVKTAEIQERFKSLGIIADWKRFDKISRVRNEVEHFYPKISQDALKGLISDSFLIIGDFVQSQLKEEPCDLLGDKTWQAMLQVTEVYEEEQKRCLESLNQIDWESDALANGLSELACRDCGSELLRPLETVESVQEVVLLCSSCGATEPSDSFIPRNLLKFG